jgi:hypothetical protein
LEEAFGVEGFALICWREMRGAVTFERLGMSISGNCLVVAGVDQGLVASLMEGCIDY